MEELLKEVQEIFPEAYIDNSHEPIASCIKVCNDTEIYLTMGGYAIHINGKYYRGIEGSSYSIKQKILKVLKSIAECEQTNNKEG